MERSRRFLQAVGSGYLLTLCLAVLNLATVPIGLGILGRPAYGLCMAVTQTVAFLSLFEMGVGPTVARFLVDYRNREDPSAYASFVKSVFFVTFLQGLLLLALIPVLAAFFTWFLVIPAVWHEDAQRLLWFSLAAAGVARAIAPFYQLLVAGQRQDLLNYATLLGNLVGTCVLLVTLCRGWGVYAFVAGGWATAVVQHGMVITACFRTGCLPRWNEGKISLPLLKPMYGFAGNVFLISLGRQLIQYAPSVMISRSFPEKIGLAMLADWSVGTKLLTFCQELITRLPGASEPAFWEMWTRREFARVKLRLESVTRLTVAATGFLGGGLVATNALFVPLWSKGQVVWNPATDWGVALWLWLLAMSLVWNMLPGITKRLGWMRYAFAGEGLLIILAGVGRLLPGLVWAPLFLAAALVLGRFTYGLSRLKNDLAMPPAEIGRWVGQSAFVMAVCLGLGALAHWAGSFCTGWKQLLLTGVLYGVAAAAFVYVCALPDDLKNRWRQRGQAPGNTAA